MFFNKDNLDNYNLLLISKDKNDIGMITNILNSKKFQQGIIMCPSQENLNLYKANLEAPELHFYNYFSESIIKDAFNQINKYIIIDNCDFINSGVFFDLLIKARFNNTSIIIFSNEMNIPLHILENIEYRIKHF